MIAWILATVLTREAPPRLSVHADEAACVAAGERWEREANELARRLKQPKPTGWICTTTTEQPS